MSTFDLVIQTGPFGELAMAVIYIVNALNTPQLVIEAITAVGELAIAGVIYYEIEAHRFASFLTDTQSADFYNRRKEIYEAYVRVLPSADASLKERADAFAALLWGDAELRSICDLQWTYIYRLRYAFRYSLLYRQVAEWFPQVLVSLWVMTNRYQRERDDIRPNDIIDYGTMAVKESLRVLEVRGKGRGLPGPAPITIYGSLGRKDRVVISSEVLKQMLGDLDAPFKGA